MRTVFFALFLLVPAAFAVGPNDYVQWYWAQNGVTNATVPDDYMIAVGASGGAEITAWNTKRGVARPTLEQLRTNTAAVTAWATNQSFQAKSDATKFSPELRAVAEWARRAINETRAATNQVSRAEMLQGVRKVYEP